MYRKCISSKAAVMRLAVTDCSLRYSRYKLLGRNGKLCLCCSILLTVEELPLGGCMRRTWSFGTGSQSFPLNPVDTGQVRPRARPAAPTIFHAPLPSSTFVTRQPTSVTVALDRLLRLRSNDASPGLKYFLKSSLLAAAFRGTCNSSSSVSVPVT